MDWQSAAVVLIELAALAFLVSRFLPAKKPRVLTKPDVPVRALLRKRDAASEEPRDRSR
jgi:hypothetical protein